jgi:hypothetical protein
LREGGAILGLKNQATASIVDFEEYMQYSGYTNEFTVYQNGNNYLLVQSHLM